jgi:hypothetical protein
MYMIKSFSYTVSGSHLDNNINMERQMQPQNLSHIKILYRGKMKLLATLITVSNTWWHDVKIR